MVLEQFRGKIKAPTGKEPMNGWFFGNLVVEKSTNKTFILDVDHTKNGKVRFKDLAVEVIPNTVGQEVRLRDKYSKRVYTGDLLLSYIATAGQGTQRYKRIPILTVVTIDKGRIHAVPFAIKREDLDKYKTHNYRFVEYVLDPTPVGFTTRVYTYEGDLVNVMGDGETCYNVEYRGNIYDNPELWEDGQWVRITEI